MNSVPVFVAVLLLAPASGWAQSAPNWQHDFPPVDKRNNLGAGNTKTENPAVISRDGSKRMTFSNWSQVNPSKNSNLAATYFGVPTWYDAGATDAQNMHLNINGMTRGWDQGTCLVSVYANSTTPNACGQGGFWDMGYRTQYPGQDSDAMFIGIQGIVPVATNVGVASLGSMTVTNQAGQSQVVGTLTLSSPLTGNQIAAINAATGPMRVQLNNGYFGYTVPKGLTSNGTAVPPMSANGLTLIVDNWTRAISPGNSTQPSLANPAPAGATAALPTFNWVGYPSSGTTLNTGTGILPNTVGMTNGSAALSAYTVVIDENQLAEDIYGGVSDSDADQVNDMRFSEISFTDNKSGTPIYDDTTPVGSLLIHTTSATLSGYQVGTVFTAISVTGTLAVGQYIAQTPLVDQIVSFGTGTGGAGTYNMSNSQTVGSSGSPQTGLVAGAATYHNSEYSFVTGSGNLAIGTGNIWGSGIRRGEVCDNPQRTAAEGATSCITDMASFWGLYVTKTTGYVFYVNPGLHGSVAALDINGNEHLKSMTASNGVEAGSFKTVGIPFSKLAGMIPCDVGTEYYVTDLRKPGEAAGVGTGGKVICTPISKGRSTTGFYSEFNGKPATN